MRLFRLLVLSAALGGTFILGGAAEHARVRMSRPAIALPAPSARLVEYAGKTEIPCPDQTDRTAVLFVFGQSNASNNGGQRFAAIDDRVLNYFAGKCYRAASPLLGAQGIMGESWTLLGNKLVSSGAADQVIIISSGIGNTRIAQWAEGGNLNTMLHDAAADAAKHYRVTAVLFHQGESDFRFKTTRDDYLARLRSTIATVRGAGIAAPFYVSHASYEPRFGPWTPDNSVVEAQAAVIDGTDVLAGPDTDAMMGPLDRFDGVHFSGAGQEKFAAAWEQILARSAR